ncbi:MAG TPA: hypothetical protein VKZ60_19440 [Chloroflexota bacterium]|nr:hypothetical protein [Chloroflexota bacterium]
MAELGLGLGTSHAPQLFLEPQYWRTLAETVDTRNPDLLSPRTGRVTPFDALRAEVAVADPALLARLAPDHQRALYDRCQAGQAAVAAALRAYAPEVLVIVSDDQEELLFDDNMPMFAIYWGSTFTLLPRQAPPGRGGPVYEAMRRGWGDTELDVPVDTALGEHLITYLAEHDFDIAHLRYLRELYGGSVGPAGYLAHRRETPPTRRGMPHGFAYVVKTILNSEPLPIVPVFVNACYPPNRPTPRRCWAFGRALRQAIEAWPVPKRVAIIASGGLSHYVLDEELDQLTIRGLQTRDLDLLAALPRLDSPTGEIRNWIVVGGACEHLTFELFDYVPAPRSEAGTGGGWCFARWASYGITSPS